MDWHIIKKEGTPDPEHWYQCSLNKGVLPPQLILYFDRGFFRDQYDKPVSCVYAWAPLPEDCK